MQREIHEQRDSDGEREKESDTLRESPLMLINFSLIGSIGTFQL